MLEMHPDQDVGLHIVDKADVGVESILGIVQAPIQLDDHVAAVKLVIYLGEGVFEQGNDGSIKRYI